jgi:hypothetical protein
MKLGKLSDSHGTAGGGKKRYLRQEGETPLLLLWHIKSIRPSSPCARA